MATFAADAADEDDDEGWAEPSPAAKSAPRSKRGRSAQPAAATGDALTAGGPAEAADSAVMPAAPPAKKQRRDELAVAAAEGAAEQATAPADEPTSAPGAMDTDPQPHQADGAGVEEPAVQLAAGDEEAAAQPAARDEEPAAAEPSAPEGVPADEQPPPRADAPAANPPRVRAISTKGHTCRGRVKQKSHKAAELVEAGTLRCARCAAASCRAQWRAAATLGWQRVSPTVAAPARTPMLQGAERLVQRGLHLSRGVPLAHPLPLEVRQTHATAAHAHQPSAWWPGV